MADTPKHSVSVAGIVIRDDGRILAIQRRDNQHWEPPGGVLELDETFEAGVRREVREETGVEVEVERLSGVYKNLPRGIVAMVFRCHPRSEAVSSTDEASRIGWLTVDEITKHMDPAYAVRVTDAFEYTPASRTHDGVRIV
ncbi:MAG: hydrolase [Frondihabitans sp.]|nr:hydrolase [Frondihabitans sp.]